MLPALSGSDSQTGFSALAQSKYFHCAYNNCRQSAGLLIFSISRLADRSGTNGAVRAIPACGNQKAPAASAQARQTTGATTSDPTSNQIASREQPSQLLQRSEPDTIIDFPGLEPAYILNSSTNIPKVKTSAPRDDSRAGDGLAAGFDFSNRRGILDSATPLPNPPFAR